MTLSWWFKIQIRSCKSVLNNTFVDKVLAFSVTSKIFIPLPVILSFVDDTADLSYGIRKTTQSGKDSTSYVMKTMCSQPDIQLMVLVQHLYEGDSVSSGFRMSPHWTVVKYFVDPVEHRGSMIYGQRNKPPKESNAKGFHYKREALLVVSYYINTEE